MAKFKIETLGKNKNNRTVRDSASSESYAISRAKSRKKEANVDKVRVTDERGNTIYMD